jgi:hypothetical protein
MTEKTLWFVLVGLIGIGIILPYRAGVVGRIAPDRGRGAKIISDITWGKSYQKDGVTITPGSTHPSFGRFNFYCAVDAAGQGSLFYTEAPGAGELPLKTKKLLIMINQDGNVTLLQQWFPLAGSRQPVKFKAIVTVRSAQLFRVLPKPDFPPLSGQTDKTAKLIWGKPRWTDGARYLPGRIRTMAGTVELAWKVVAGGTPELIDFGRRPGAGELPAREDPLYPVDDIVARTTTIYQERQPLANQPGSACLWPLVVVKTSQLLAKLKQL